MHIYNMSLMKGLKKLNQLRIQQLTSADSAPHDGQHQVLLQQKGVLEQQITEIQQHLKKTNTEKDQMSQQYQQYCQQLNTQQQSLSKRLQEVTAENEKFSNRDKDLIKHVNELEKQIQNGSKKLTAPQLSNDKEIMELTLTYTTLEQNYKDLQNTRDQQISNITVAQQQLAVCDTQIRELKEIIKEYEETIETLRGDKPDTVKLSAAIESDKLAASRAMSQNKDLKMQLEELQSGFVQMSNYKLEITEKLHAEQHLGRELIKKLKKILAAKNEEMIRLQHESTDLEKQILQQSQPLPSLLRRIIQEYPNRFYCPSQHRAFGLISDTGRWHCFDVIHLLPPLERCCSLCIGHPRCSACRRTF